MIFRKLSTVEGARKVLMANARKVKTEMIGVDTSLGRVLAQDVVSTINVPHFKKAAMDGYAVRSQDTTGASRVKPVTLKLIETVYAGQVPKRKVSLGTCTGIATGAMIPRGSDAVIMVEYTKEAGNLIKIYKETGKNKHVVKEGSDIRKGGKVLWQGLTLRPRHTAVLSSLGLAKVMVRKRPKVALLSTGNELLRPGERLTRGKIYGINNRALSDALEQVGASVIDLGIVGDDVKKIKDRINSAIKRTDLILVSGGSSVGKEDLVPGIVSDLGKVLLHGISIKPGKPVLIGKIKSKLVIGLPGYPTSALTVFHAFVIPLLNHMMNKDDDRISVEALMSEEFSSGKRHTFLPVKIDVKSETRFAIAVFKGSAAITSLGLADGFIEIPPNTTIRKRAKVTVLLF